MKTLLRPLLPMLFLGTALFAADVQLTLKPKQELNKIDEKIYSHFLEHIYHSVNGGLWGDLVWNRSFEDNEGSGWSLENNIITQKSRSENQRFLFGETNWSDYEFTVEAQKTGGAEGFLLLFRVQNDRVFSWANIGGFRNEQHAIERRNARQNRQAVVGPMPNGSIESNKWYTIKIRCEGNNVKVSLDGQQILDVTDAEMAKTGCVGIGTWSTQAQFRNFKVTTLDGQTVLFNKTPEISPSVKIRHWEIGDGVKLESGATVPNGKVWLHINPGDNGTAISQKGFMLKKGEEYNISMWSYAYPFYENRLGQFMPKIDVLFDNVPAETGDIVDRSDAPNPVVKRRWSFIPEKDMDNATLQIRFGGGGFYNIDQISIMPKSWAAKGGFRPDLLQAIADLKAPTIRYPGGCFASAYRWKDGIGPQEKRGEHPFTIWDDRDVNSFGTDEFVDMCRRVGSEPLIVINIGTPMWNVRRTPETADVDWLQEACDWLEYCNGPATSKWGKVRAENGHPEPYNVKYWEIDNEIEIPVEDYIAAIKKFVPAMKKIDPSIKIIACGSWRGGDRMLWDAPLVNGAGELFDYLSFHQYDDPNLYANGPGVIENYFRSLKEVIDKSPNKNIKIFDSEWNAQSTDWRTGLYCGGILNVFERCGDVVEIAAPALFLRHNTANAWDNAFINFDNKSWYPAPNYVVMKLWREHYAPTRIGLDGDVNGLNIVATKSADGKTFYIKAVNPTNEVRNVTLNVGADVKSATLKLVSASLNDRNTLTNPNTIAPKNGEAKLEGRTVKFVLPALSAGVVAVE